MRMNVLPCDIKAGDILIKTGQTVKEVKYSNSLGTAFRFTAGLSLLLARDTGYEIERPAAPEAVVVDTSWAYVFSAPESGIPFSLETAREFRDERNDGLKVPTYKVYRLELVED
jgi:hypothetical protein